MNQNNLQGIRQVSPEEVAQAEGVPLTQQDLQKTQVLNLKEVEEAARFEKLTSKKPAIIVAIIGALLLTFGTTFQITQSMSRAEKKVEKRKETPVEVVPKNTALVCELISNHPENGTSEIYSVTFEFDDQGLTRETKVSTVSATSGSELGSATVKGLEEGYKKFLNPVPGYTIAVVPNNTYTQIVTTVDADLTKIDFMTFPEFQRTYYVTNVDYPLNTSKEVISTELQTAGFTCN